jgi:hypothetical protein
MIMRLPASAPFVIALFMLSAASASFARIGENQDEFDRRILQPDIGKLTPKRKSADPANTEQLLRQQPFFTTREHFPPGIRERLYWKSAVPRMLSNENGWRVHVFFHETRSVLEAYLRVGDTLNEFEIQNILRANQGDSVWREVDPESEEAAAAPIGASFALADGTLKARIDGNWLMIYSSKLEDYVREQLRVIQEKDATQQTERLREQQLTAPESTAGF